MNQPLPVSATVEIDADVDSVWRAVSDVRRMGEWSPECRRIVVLASAVALLSLGLIAALVVVAVTQVRAVSRTGRSSSESARSWSGSSDVSANRDATRSAVARSTRSRPASVISASTALPSSG